MNKLLIATTALLVLYSCQSTENSEHNAPWMSLDGKQLMEDRCYSCHNMLAPPMFRVKDHYWEDDINEQDFIEAIVEWVKDPKEENSLMPGARRKFGLMPKQQFDENEVRAIAKYMFNHEI